MELFAVSKSLQFCTNAVYDLLNLIMCTFLNLLNQVKFQPKIGIEKNFVETNLFPNST